MKVKTLKINGKTVKTNGKFAYDGCHKIYVLEDLDDIVGAVNNGGYDILRISEIEKVYNKSCPFRFISNWKLDEKYVEQFEEDVKFEFDI